MTYIIYEVDYSCSPGGVNCWEISNNNGDFITGGFDTARSAFDYLIENIPPNKRIRLEVHSLAWWHEKEGVLV